REGGGGAPPLPPRRRQPVGVDGQGGRQPGGGRGHLSRDDSALSRGGEVSGAAGGDPGGPRRARQGTRGPGRGGEEDERHDAGPGRLPPGPRQPEPGQARESPATAGAGGPAPPSPR